MHTQKKRCLTSVICICSVACARFGLCSTESRRQSHVELNVCVYSIYTIPIYQYLYILFQFLPKTSSAISYQILRDQIVSRRRIPLRARQHNMARIHNTNIYTQISNAGWTNREDSARESKGEITILLVYGICLCIFRIELKVGKTRPISPCHTDTQRKIDLNSSRQTHSWSTDPETTPRTEALPESPFFPPVYDIRATMLCLLYRHACHDISVWLSVVGCCWNSIGPIAWAFGHMTADSTIL